MAGDKKGGPSGTTGDPPYGGEARSGLSKSDTRLTSLDQRILESAIRNTVTRIVSARNSELSNGCQKWEIP